MEQKPKTIEELEKGRQEVLKEIGDIKKLAEALLAKKNKAKVFEEKAPEVVETKVPEEKPHEVVEENWTPEDEKTLNGLLGTMGKLSETITSAQKRLAEIEIELKEEEIASQPSLEQKESKKEEAEKDKFQTNPEKIEGKLFSIPEIDGSFKMERETPEITSCYHKINKEGNVYLINEEGIKRAINRLDSYLKPIWEIDKILETENANGVIVKKLPKVDLISGKLIEKGELELVSEKGIFYEKEEPATEQKTETEEQKESGKEEIERRRQEGLSLAIIDKSEVKKMVDRMLGNDEKEEYKKERQIKYTFEDNLVNGLANGAVTQVIKETGKRGFSESMYWLTEMTEYLVVIEKGKEFGLINNDQYKSLIKKFQEAKNIVENEVNEYINIINAKYDAELAVLEKQK